MTVWTSSQAELIGALIGLSRTCFSNPKTNSTDALITSSLAGVRSYNDAQLSRQTELIAQEKHIISPGCATCPNPCGNTDDYDMNLILSAQDDIKQAKTHLLDRLLTLCEHISPTSSDTDCIAFIYRALSVLSWDWDADMIEPVCAECDDWLKKYQS